MLRTLKKMLIGVTSLLGFSCAFGLILLLNPSLSYAHQTQLNQVKVFHQQPLEPELKVALEKALTITSQSELFISEHPVKLCLNDGSRYPGLLGRMRGGVAYTFLNHVVMNQCELDVQQNIVFWRWAVNQYEWRSWNLTELLAHELTHVYQNEKNTFDVLHHPSWKIEGYAEYIARKGRGPGSDLFEQWLKAENQNQTGLPWFTFEDGTGIPVSYMKNWLQVQYLMDVKGMSYREVLADTSSQNTLLEEMKQYYAP